MWHRVDGTATIHGWQNGETSGATAERAFKREQTHEKNGLPLNKLICCAAGIHSSLHRSAIIDIALHCIYDASVRWLLHHVFQKDASFVDWTASIQQSIGFDTIK
jgi:hypothetical protein